MKYMRMKPRPSRSSLLLCSQPKWVLMEQYLHGWGLTWVKRGGPDGAGEGPVFLVGDVRLGFGVSVFPAESVVYQVDQVGVFLNSDEEVFRLDIPMDIMFGVELFQTHNLPLSTCTICSASIITVFRLNCLSHSRNRSYRLGPNNYIAMYVDLFSCPTQYTFGNPTMLSYCFSTFDSSSNCGCFVLSSS